MRWCANHWPGGTIGGHSLSQPFGLPAPSEREPGMGCAIQRAARKPWGCGRFSSPLRNSECFGFYHSTDDTPSVSLSLDSSLREGAGIGLCHSTCRPETVGVQAIFIAPTKLKSFYISPFNGGHSLSQPFGLPAPSGREPGMGVHHSTCRPETVGVRAIFIAPTKLKSFLHFTIHRGTLPQSRVRSTAPSEREPGMGLCHSTCRPETVGVRAIFIAPTKAQRVLHFTIHRGGCKIRKRAILGKMALGGVIFPELPGRWCSRRF